VHEAVFDFVKRWATDDEVAVLDIGGRRVTSDLHYPGPPLRDLFPNADPYEVLDLEPGPGVDIVADATHLSTFEKLYGASYDTVICTSVLEHVQQWRNILFTAHAALCSGGRLILTCAGPGFVPHSGLDEEAPHEGEHYANISHIDLRKELAHAGFKDILTWQVGPDTQATAVA
jgi:hypothetical protein